ncbi:hypothetical protein MYCTH_2312904 [Thermothelomyces thermophilus ATCC 42464]|uniref:Ca2+-modulated nonselective cation channel polycystin n=1 Tax=Thermothelomyces thermophilus (strain ATCC 42464 / BCRC 31852 / DSM 1799) TaxID=573729 RepID=G2QNE5_THET4|nr:uncharacterized protein MYCTH_2312904 [Thermothelomyces thermophilus ATCC 42464]AEO62018.1 hypothetical protein MYCTH_2312904 [Thermothelomyces thermophilus ATCC 42464]
MTDQSGRLGRRRPFSALMKKLANLKATSSGDGGRLSGSKRNGAKKPQNNPYPQSGRIAVGISPRPSHYSVSSGPSRRLTSVSSLDRSDSVRSDSDDQPPPTTGARSMAPTVSMEHETVRSILAPSHGDSSLAGTSRTANGRRGGDSTFSSPAPSVRSLTTTLTTIQTIAPNPGGTNNQATTNHHSHSSNSQVIHFNQPFPSTSPASAIPAHLATTTYASATANNLLTDNASILTLASSSKRRRRRSFDTDASVRALAPSSLWGGSRESLPLSVLSATMDGAAAAAAAAAGNGPPTPGLHRGAGSGVMGGGANERTSIYSATGILGTAASERNSLYAKPGLGTGNGGVGGGDAASVRSGLMGHGRADSVAGSIGGGLAAPAAGTSSLASPREGLGEEKGEGKRDTV